MAGSKEIRNKIKSVQSTRKITKAMEMVAASKMKKAQDRMRASRPYVAARAADRDARREGQHRVPASVPGPARDREARRRDRRHDRQGPVRRPQHQHPAAASCSSTRSGRPRASRSTTSRSATRAWASCSRMGANVVSSVVQLGDRPHLDRLVGPVKVLFDKYMDGDGRRGARLLHELRQHDEAGAAPRGGCCRSPSSSAPSTGEVRKAEVAGGHVGLHLRARRARRCSTACCAATSRRSSSRWSTRTWPPSSRRGWSR